MSRLILEAISCGRTTEARDELYLVVWPDDGAGKWIWGPKSINNGDTDTINAECDFDRHIHINLYNADPYAVLLNPDDNLGGYLI